MTSPLHVSPFVWTTSVVRMGAVVPVGSVPKRVHSASTGRAKYRAPRHAPGGNAATTVVAVRAESARGMGFARITSVPVPHPAPAENVGMTVAAVRAASVRRAWCVRRRRDVVVPTAPPIVQANNAARMVAVVPVVRVRPTRYAETSNALTLVHAFPTVRAKNAVIMVVAVRVDHVPSRWSVIHRNARRADPIVPTESVAMTAAAVHADHVMRSRRAMIRRANACRFE